MAVHRSLPHESAALHVTGAAKYTGDLSDLRGLLHCWPVLSPHAHARVLNLDTLRAERAEGVHRVLTAGDVPGQNNVGPVRHDEPLFPEVVLYHSQPVCWVIAESEDFARAACNLINVEYEVLEPILGIQKALEHGSFHTETARMRRGEPELAFEKSEHVLTGVLDIGGQDHFYLETHAAQAYLDENGQMTVHSSTQHPSETQTIVAEVLGLALNQVTVQSLRMGGGFGGKETQANHFAAVAALGAVLTGRPVRCRLSRHLDMRLTGKRHPFQARYIVGFSSAGLLEGLKLELYSDGGWSLDLSEAILYRALFHSDNCYFIPNMDVSGRVCKTHVTSHTAFRGFGGPQGMVAIEEILDRVARALNLKPERVRELNFYSDDVSEDALERRTTHYGQPMEEVRVQRIWNELLETGEFEGRRLEIEKFNLEHPYLRRGIAITPVKFGISFTATHFNQAGALVLIFQDGSVQVNHGGTEMGQGLHTKMLQIAAQALGIPLEQVRIMPTRTDKVPNTSATAASSGADLNGAAVKDACDTLLERLKTVAAGMFEPSVHAQDVRVSNGLVTALGREQAFGFAQVVKAAYMQRVQLSSAGFYRTPDIFFNKNTGKGVPFRYFAWGAAISEVELDTLTGMWTLEETDILHDCGNSLNPFLDRGQVEGGFIQGMGWLTMEELVWDESGRLRTYAPSTYKIPTLADVPVQFKVSLLPRADENKVVYGSKAVGEPPLMLGISVREALRDAVASVYTRANPDGVLLASPATPEALLNALERLKSLERNADPQAVSTD
jgi:xanthine dehydrogenase large subunit